MVSDGLSSLFGDDPELKIGRLNPLPILLYHRQEGLGGLFVPVRRPGRNPAKHQAHHIHSRSSQSGYVS
jgi:hypothetical protein